MTRRTLAFTGVAVAVAAIMGLVLSQLVFPRSLYTGGTTLTLLSGETLVQAYREREFLPAKDGRTLSAGDRVRTPAGSRSVITFFEGSTMTLEPETEIAISSQLYGPASQPGASAIGVQQVSGTTWSRVQRLAPPASLYQVETSAGVVIVRGSLAWVQVDAASGRTEARSYAGLLAARALGAEVELPPFTGTVIERGQAPEAVRPVAPPAQRLVFTVTTRIWLRVIDPAHRTVGFVSPGIQLSQMVGGLVSLPFAAPTTVTVPIEGSGEYEIVIEGASEGSYQFAVQGFSDGDQVFLRALEGSIKPDRRFQGRLAVRVENGRFVEGGLSQFSEIPEGEGPGKFVRTRLSVTGASQTATAVIEEGTPTPIVTPTPTLTRTPTLTPSPTATETPTGTPRVAVTAVVPVATGTPTYTPGPAP